MNIILYPPQNPVLFTLFNQNVRYYGVIIALAILIGVIYCSYLIKKFISDNDSDIFLDIAPLTILISIIGARLFYVLGNLEFYLNNLKEILLVNHGGISIYGAILFGIITVFILSKIKKFDLLRYFDCMAIVLPLCQGIGRFGNFCNQEAYGIPSSSFIKMFIAPEYRYPQFMNNDYYHPAFLYEAIPDILLSFLLLFVFVKFKKLKKGTILALYLISYSIIRIIVEAIRIDSVLNISNIHCATILAIIAIISSIILLSFIYVHKNE